MLDFLTKSIAEITQHLDTSDDDCLFPLQQDSALISDKISIMRRIEQLDNSCFYGRSMGFQVTLIIIIIIIIIIIMLQLIMIDWFIWFQFAPSIGRVFHFIGIVLATYSVRWEKGTSWASLLHSGRLMLSPERRAKRIIKVTREADISFCKGFWNMSEEGLYYVRTCCIHCCCCCRRCICILI